MTIPFGFNEKNPPYRPIPGGGEMIGENWDCVEGECGKYDKYFIYYECRQTNGKVWFDRHTRPEWEDKIPNSLLHAPIEEIENYLSK